MSALQNESSDASCWTIPRVRVHLLELNLMRGNWITLDIKDEEAGAGGAIVDSTDEAFVTCLSQKFSERRKFQLASLSHVPW